MANIEAPEPLETIPAEEEALANVKLSPYEVWRQDPSQSNLYTVTKSLKPTIDSVLAGMQGTGNPHLAAKARVVAAKAIKSYDPEAGTTLPTWVSQQLRQLARESRKSNNVISIPEGVQLDGYAIYRAEAEFMDKYDREPTVAELADASHLSVKRIEEVRKQMRPVANEGAFEAEGNNGIQGGQNDYSKDALDYVYNDSDLLDRKILEYAVGYGGTEMKENKDIMERLNLTPVQFTRRKARLSMRINEIIKNLEEIQ